SFLYPENGYNPNVIDENLLRGPFILSVLLPHIFTGPRTATSENLKKLGKKSIAELYDINEVTPESIGYVATLCRHVLNGKESWSTQDGGFHTDIFYTNIVDLFDDDKWKQETLSWWNEWVFGDDPRTSDTPSSPDGVSCVSMLAAQRAARQRQESMQEADSQTQSREESTPA
ncbi:hypothetical protein BC826DRAFT_922014, partial [Russula brevipes]